MQRIHTSSRKASKPPYTSGKTGGYFGNGDPAVGDPATQFDAEWCNMVQEELAGLATLDGSALSDTDDGQCAEVLKHVLALLGSTTDTGVATCQYSRALLAANSCQATGARSVIVASSTNCEATGIDTFIGASSDGVASGNNATVLATADDCRAEGNKSAVVACTDECDAEGVNSFVAGSSVQNKAQASESSILSSVQCTTTGQQSLVAGANSSDAEGLRSGVLNSTNSSASAQESTTLGSAYTENNVANSVALGYAASGPRATTNMTIRFEANGGNGYFDGGADIGTADYAELFENAEAGEIPVGSIVTRRGRRCAPAGEGDRILGVVSSAPGIVGNAAPMSWQGRYELDEFGRKIMDEVPMLAWEPQKVVDEEGNLVHRIPGYRGPADQAPELRPEMCEGWLEQVPRQVAGYDPSRDYSPRRQRPEEWTVVGLMGQLYVRIDETVGEEDLLVGGAGGVGTRATKKAWSAAGPTTIEVMEITTPYDAERGYGVALCLVR